MKNLVIENGTVVTLGTPNSVIEKGCVVIRDGKIVAVGPAAKVRSKGRGLPRLDAEGNLIMPGYICAHHHLYSTFARGMALPNFAPRNFLEILKGLWWKLDNALSAQDIYWSAFPPLIECIRRGTTTLFDHHESQSFQVGSLGRLEKAVSETGLRAVLTLGVSDRYGRGAEGIEENERFLKKVSAAKTGRVKAMAGLHASFTVKPGTLERVAELAAKYGVGVHTHCAEDLEDERHSLKKYGKRVVRRLKDAGVLGENSLFAHCVHVDSSEMRLLRETGTPVAHNPESNMNNAVGAADVLMLMREGILVGLGTDGMSSDMPSQARCAYLLQRHFLRNPRVAFVECCEMLLKNNSEIVRRVAGWRAGVLRSGYEGDAIVVRYNPPTPMSFDNFLGHFMFGIVHAPVLSTVVGGEVLMKNGRILKFNEGRALAKSREAASRFWNKV